MCLPNYVLTETELTTNFTKLIIVFPLVSEYRTHNLNHVFI